MATFFEILKLVVHVGGNLINQMMRFGAQVFSWLLLISQLGGGEFLL